MTLAKFQPNRTTGSKVMAKNLKKRHFLGTGYPEQITRFPDFANYPVLVTRSLTSLAGMSLSR